MKKILIIQGSSRQGRSSDHVVRWVTSYVNSAKPKDFQFDIVDLREEDLPFFDSPIPPLMDQYPEGKVTEWAKKIATYDGFLIVTPEYNHGYPAVLKNALDLIYKEWNYKPVAFVSYGAHSGGIRAVEQLRQVVIELRMIPLKEDVSIPFIWQAFDDKGNLQNSDHYNHALQAILDAYGRYFSVSKQ